ncbi:MAG: PIG-L family deacetylase [Actinomycetota bacterium]|nr:PIG-L family deacetylase [Actinomycetota bacterium]
MIEGRAFDDPVVFFHAHPDDEAIFTGGTIALLAGHGCRVVLVTATGGEHGARTSSAAAKSELAGQRAAETLRAAALLGLARVEFLGYRDSGMLGDPGNTAPGAFWSADQSVASDHLSGILREERAGTLVVYDQVGIYGHPDHVQAHRVGVKAAEKAGVDCVYEVTVDREYLHFVETHLVVEAGVPGALGVPPDQLGLAGSSLGVPTVEVTTTVDVRPVLGVKRAAMAAHASQIPETASAMRLPTEAFGAVYGFEWFVRRGRPGPLDHL